MEEQIKQVRVICERFLGKDWADQHRGEPITDYVQAALDEALRSPYKKPDKKPAGWGVCNG